MTTTTEAPTTAPLTEHEQADPVIRALSAGREKIARPDRWTQGTYARDAYGAGVTALDGKAYRYCASGAAAAGAHSVYPFTDRPGSHAQLRADVLHYLNKAALETTGAETRSIVLLNDTGLHRQVLAAYDHAIELRRAELRLHHRDDPVHAGAD